MPSEHSSGESRCRGGITKAGVRRLVDRRRAMDAAGKQSSVASVAIARELACWCWAVGRMAEKA